MFTRGRNACALVRRKIKITTTTLQQRSRRSFPSCPHGMRNTRVSRLFYVTPANFLRLEGRARASAIFFVTIMLVFPGYPVYTYTSTCVNLSGEKFLHLRSWRNSSTDRSANLRELLRIWLVGYYYYYYYQHIERILQRQVLPIEGVSWQQYLQYVHSVRV